MFIVLVTLVLSLAALVSVDAGQLYTTTTPSHSTVYYEQPAGTPKGVVLALHGCDHGAEDFWNRSSSCLGCHGLPVGLTTSAYIVKNGYIFASFSTSSLNGCWSSISDGLHFGEVVQLLNKKFSVPLFVYGISIGGAFMSSNIALWVDEGTLHTKYKIAGMCLHVSAINHMPKQLHLYPPTLFVPMLKDHPSALKAKHASKHLQAARVHTSLITLEAIPLTASFFHDHGAGLFSMERSTKLFESLKKAKYVSEAGLILDDPRDNTEWENAAALLYPTMDFSVNRSPIKELMNMAFAYHEISDAHLQQLMQFFGTFVK